MSFSGNELVRGTRTKEIRLLANAVFKTNGEILFQSWIKIFIRFIQFGHIFPELRMFGK